ncbi:hypothetical protein L1887_32835 [Cichorium endivia]|nr:hypothetical protein L1887_32835 [Cichorium endivia]
MKTDQGILKTLEKMGSLNASSFITPCLTDELDWSLNLNDFELTLIRDMISNGSSSDDQNLASKVFNIEVSDIGTVLPQHRSVNFRAIGTTVPGVKDAIDVALNSDFTAAKSNEMVSGGKDHRAPRLVKEAIPLSLPERRYKGVRLWPSGKFSAEIHSRSLEKKRRKLWLGTYDTAEEAAMAYDRAAFKDRGSKAVLNFPLFIGTHNVGPEKDMNKKPSPRYGGGSRYGLFTAAQSNEMVSGGKDHRGSWLVKEAIPPLLPERRYKGVSLRRSGKFSAEIHLRNPEKKGRMWLGTYDTAEEAAMAYDRAAFKYRGSNAVLNFPHLIGTRNVSPEKDMSKKRSPMSEGSSSSLSLESSRNNHLKEESTAV